MFGGLGTTELLIIFMIIIVLFGSKLPKIGAGLGKGIRNFKKEVSSEKQEDNDTEKEQSINND